jgi:sensor domain CHASE-containing protein
MRIIGSGKHGGKLKRRRIKVNNNYMILILIFVIVGVSIGAGVELYNTLQTNINAQIKAQINLKVQEATEQFKTEYKANRKLYRAIYTSSFKQEVFYFQTNENPFEIAKNYLPDEWTGLQIEEVRINENSTN